MKTLRNTSILVLVALSLGFVNLFAKVPVTKINMSKTTVNVTSVSERERVKSENALRVEMINLLNGLSIKEKGKVNIVFKVNSKKQIEIMNVFGANRSLISSVVRSITEGTFVVPKALEGNYMIAASF